MKVEKSLIVVPRNLAGEDKQTLFQLIDVDNSLHFELLWTGKEWIDCPGESIEQAIIGGVPNIQDWTTSPKEWTEGFFPGALDARFTSADPQEIENFRKLEGVELAEAIARFVHSYERDRSGNASIDQVQKIVGYAQDIPSFKKLYKEVQSDVIQGAWLCRVLERRELSGLPRVLPSDLAEWGVSRDALSIVEFLMRAPSLMEHLGKSRETAAYLQDIATHSSARLVKLAQVIVGQFGESPSEILEYFELESKDRKWFTKTYDSVHKDSSIPEWDGRLIQHRDPWLDPDLEDFPSPIQRSSKMTSKKTIYIDMDNVLVNFQSGIDRLPIAVQEEYKDRLDEVEGIFALMDPNPGAVEAFKLLAKRHHVYILSTAPWKNHSAWSDKVAWVQLHLGKDEGEAAWKRLILSHHKNLNKGDFLIDDRLANGAGEFEGELIHFGPKDEKEKRDGRFPDWDSVIDFFKSKNLLD
jgi:5'(3')-deoxyribonucleotidase